ncbi:hypothetical protein EDB85DRAFT_1890296 [Lactarius pseudohatsudake]|nr:hypothetical protein EDB85DRAFT_1890296 [Lactarius pseudohatsudake]
MRASCIAFVVLAAAAAPALSGPVARGVGGFGPRLMGSRRSADELNGRAEALPPSTDEGPDIKRFTDEIIGRNEDISVPPSTDEGPDIKRFTDEIIGRNEDISVPPSTDEGPDTKRACDGLVDVIYVNPESGFDSLDTAEREGKAKPGVNNKDMSEGSFFTDATLADRSIDEPRGTSSATFTRHHDPRRGVLGSFLGSLEADGALDGAYIIARAHGSRSVVSQRVFINRFRAFLSYRAFEFDSTTIFKILIGTFAATTALLVAHPVDIAHLVVWGTKTETETKFHRQ